MLENMRFCEIQKRKILTNRKRKEISNLFTSFISKDIYVKWQNLRQSFNCEK